MPVTCVKRPPFFDLEQTLTCGQCFRYALEPDGWAQVMAGERRVRVRQREDTLLFEATGEEAGDFWLPYFDLNADYGKIRETLYAHTSLRPCMEAGAGIRILRQDPFEVLLCFIISQNNNIPRIQGIVERLCEQWGRPLAQGYAFPTPQALANLTVEDLAPLRSGFRAKYILDAAQKVAWGQVDLQQIARLPLEQARAQLMTIRGVGVKVADCTLLFGFHRLECFPVDVWIARAMEELFPHGADFTAGPYAGLAQQYIFFYARNCRALTQKKDR